MDQVFEELKFCCATDAKRILTEILNSKDIAYINALSRHYGELLPIIIELQGSNSSHNFEKKYFISALANFLSEAKLNGCRCGFYRSSSAHPVEEEKKGFVAICPADLARDATYSCRCVFCERTFNIYEREERFGTSMTWKRTNLQRD